jgi:hypothetical protein
LTEGIKVRSLTRGQKLVVALLGAEHDSAVAAPLLAHPRRDAFLIVARLDERPNVVLGTPAGELEKDVRGALCVDDATVTPR